MTMAQLSTDSRVQLLRLIELYYDDPVGYAHDVIGISDVAPEQVEMLEACRDHRRVSIRSGRGPGKTAAMVWLALWYVCTRYRAQVVVTSSTETQLKNVFWAQLSKFFGQLSPIFRDVFDLQGEALRHRQFPREWFITRITARKENPENIQGYHAEHLLIIADEAAGIPDEIMIAVEGSMTEEDNRLVMVGNPLQSKGYFYDSHHRARSLYKRLHYNSETASRVHTDFPETMAARYGKDSPYYYAYVLGEFPPAEINQLISRDLVDGAAGKHLQAQAYTHAPKLLGVDVARYGDDKSAIIRRQGLAASGLQTWHGLDTMALSNLVANEIEDWQPDAVFVDSVGVGAGVVDRLRQLGHRVIAVNGGERAVQAAKMFNLRAEMWVKMRDWLRDGGAIPDDEELRDDLTGPLYTFDNKGRLQLERKEDMKKLRGLASPDKADALAMTFAQPVASRDNPRLKAPVLAKMDYELFGDL